MTLQEIELLAALAQRLGWVENDPTPGMIYTEKPAFYRVVDKTHGFDVAFAFQRSQVTEGRVYKGNNLVTAWSLRFVDWNPLESLDDAWMLVEAIATDDFAKISFMFLAPPVSIAHSAQEVARGICLAAAKAWGIETELTS